MKRFMVTILTLSLIFCLFSSASAQEKVTLRYAHVERIESPQHQFAVDLAGVVEELTDGQVVIEVFPNAQLGEVSEIIDGVKIGTIDMGHHVFAALGKVVNDMNVLGAPYIFRGPEHGLAAANPETSPVLRELNQQLVEKGNMRVIGSYTRGYRNFSCNFAVHSPEDLEGVKVRGVPLPIWTSMLKGMGAIPVPIAIAEVPTALMTGTVKCQENPLMQMWAAKIYEVQSHIMMTKHMMDLLPVFINNDKWEKMSELNRDMTKIAIKAVSDKSLAWTIQKREQLKQQFREKDVAIVEEENIDIEAFREKVLAQIKKDFPEWADYIRMIQEMTPAG